MVPADDRRVTSAVMVAALLFSAACATASAAEQKASPKSAPKAGAERVYPIGYDDTPRLPGSKWRVHDIERPQPPVVVPGEFSLGAEPPEDAVVLFDGTDLSQWVSKVRVRTKRKGGPPKVTYETAQPDWKVQDGYVEATGPGNLVSKEAFGDCQIHVEWATPAEAVHNSVGRGNSGILVMERYEIQILDSYENPAYADGQAGAIYGQYPPLVNASRKPGQWQSFDLFFTAPKFDGEKLVEPACVTVLHNGVLIHNQVKLLGEVKHKYVATYSPHAAEEPILLQYHRNPVRFRNIWVRRLKGYDE